MYTFFCFVFRNCEGSKLFLSTCFLPSLIGERSLLFNLEPNCYLTDSVFPFSDNIVVSGCTQACAPVSNSKWINISFVLDWWLIHLLMQWCPKIPVSSFSPGTSKLLQCGVITYSVCILFWRMPEGQALCCLLQCMELFHVHWCSSPRALFLPYCSTSSFASSGSKLPSLLQSKNPSKCLKIWNWIPY